MIRNAVAKTEQVSAALVSHRQPEFFDRGPQVDMGRD